MTNEVLNANQTVASAKQQPTYRLKFEDDGDQVRPIGAQWVVEVPR